MDKPTATRAAYTIRLEPNWTPERLQELRSELRSFLRYLQNNQDGKWSNPEHNRKVIEDVIHIAAESEWL